MAFTYVDPSSGDRDKVRFLVQDTDSTDAHLQDAEITYLVSTWGNVYDAAIAAAEIISGQYANKTNYSRSIGDLSISESYATSAAEFRAVADRLREQKNRLYPPTPKINASAILSTEDRTQTTFSTEFRTGLHDYTV
jgi:hypothetical protein